MLLEKCGEITPKKKRRRRDGAKTKTMPSCGCDGMEIKSDAIKSNVA